MKLTKQELEFAKRQLALENAIAIHRLEGIEPDPQTIKDLESVVRGEIDIQEAIRLAKERIVRGDF